MKKAFLLLFAIICLNSIISAQQPGAIDPSFNPTDIGFGNGDGANDEIYVTSIQSDGKIIISGDFTVYNGTTMNHIARLNTDGSLDETFNPGTGPNSNIQSISFQSDGKIVIGGWFTMYNGTRRNRIARLNSDGSLDATFNPGTSLILGANNDINTTFIQTDGKIVIGGNFTSYSGTAINRIARLNVDGSLDASFNTGTGANGSVGNTSIQSDGKIIVSGGFTTYNGTERNNIARLNTDGSLDETFYPGTGANFIGKISIQSDGKIVVSGGFTSFNGIERNRIARLNTDGSLDDTFNPGTGASDVVRTTSIQSDGKIVIGGNFTSYNGTTKNRIARLNVDGSLDNTFNTGEGTDKNIKTVSIQSDGKIIIGGEFTSYSETGRNRIARIYGGEVTGLNNVETSSNLKVYPNPVIDELTIEVEENHLLSSLEIINSMGQIIHKENFTSKTLINTSKFVREFMY